MLGDSGRYLQGEQYNRLIHNFPLLLNFRENRDFLAELVEMPAVNLLRPHLIICFVRGTEVILGDTGLRRALSLPSNGQGLQCPGEISEPASKMEELKSNLVDQDYLTAVPLGLTWYYKDKSSRHALSPDVGEEKTLTPTC